MRKVLAPRQEYELARVMILFEDSDAQHHLFWAVTAFLGLLLITWLSVPYMQQKNRTRSLTDLKALARTYVSFSEKVDVARSKSFTTSKRKESLSCVNFRDCGMVSPELRQGCIYRSSQVFSSSEIQALKLEAVLDLRVLKKPCRKDAHLVDAELRRTDPREKAAQLGSSDVSSSDDEGYISMHSLDSRRHKEGLRKCSICTVEFARRHGVSVPIYHSDLVPWRTKMRVFGKLPAATKLQAVKEIVHLRNPEKLVASAVVDPEVMGPKILYKLLLDHSKHPFATALRLFASGKNYPVLVHCIHGKDRTGLIIMLLLLICDVPPKLVVADYIQSELQLKAGRDKGDLQELDEFLKTDHVIASKAETMVETIAHLEEHYGGARKYCRVCGLSDAELGAIRDNMMVRPAKQLDAKSRAADEDAGVRPNIDKHVNQEELQAEQATQACRDTPHQDPVLSDVALQAAGDAIKEEAQKSDRIDPEKKALLGAAKS